jgi:hypothetical protein
VSYLDPSDTIVFRCPQCNQFISSMQTSCRFCQLPITEEIVTGGAAATFNENREYRIGLYKKVFYVGLGMFFTGFVIIAFFVVSMMARGEGNFYYIGPILLVAGAGQIILGLHGIYTEKRSRFKSN